MVLGSVLLSYAIVASKARSLFKSKKSMTYLYKGAGGVMMTTGATLVVKN